MPSDSSRDVLDVAIVGAGVSGLYAAWRLLTAAQPHVTIAGSVSRPADLRVTVFEASDRVGGRVCTVRFPEMPNVPVELGAEGYFEVDPHFAPDHPDAAHRWPGDTLVDWLARHFKLPTERIDQGNDRNLLRLRGRTFALGDLTNPLVVPYTLEWFEGVNIDNLLAFAFDRVVPGARQRTAQEWWASRRTATFGKESLCDITLDRALQSVLTAEARHFLRDSASDHLVFDGWNAADAIPQMLCTLAGDQPTRLFSNGLQSFANALADAFRDAGGRIALSHALRAVSVTPVGCPERFRLELVESDGTRREVVAKDLILALPLRALSALCDRSPELIAAAGPAFRSDVESVTGVVARKTYLQYAYPWWRRLGTTGGFVTTDTDLRCLFYFQTQGEQSGAADPANQNSLLLASLRTFSGAASSFPAGPLPQGMGDPAFAHADVAAGRAPLFMRGLSQQALSAVNNCVKEIHSLENIPEPRVGLDIVWDENNPYGFGWCYWKPGVRSWEVQERMRRPRGSLRVFVCGCSYSNEQGWVNGALVSAEQLLRASFGVERADWMPFDYLPY